MVRCLTPFQPFLLSVVLTSPHSTAAKDLRDESTSAVPSVTSAPSVSSSLASSAPTLVSPTPSMAPSMVPSSPPSIATVLSSSIPSASPLATSATPTMGPTTAAATPPTAHQEHHISVWRFIEKTIALCMFLVLALLGFGALMANRYRIYFFLRGVWYTILGMECTHWIMQKLGIERTIHDSSLNTVIFENEMNEGLLLRQSE